MKVKGGICCTVVAVALIAALVVPGCAPAPSPEEGPAPPAPKEPIKIGYIGQVASPGTKPPIEIGRMAIEEINEAGGILGRPVEYIVADNKGETALSVEACTRLVMQDKVLAYLIEGRSEINLAIQEKAAALFPEYPHIAITDGAMDRGITDKCIDEPEKYKFWFRNWDPEPTHYCWMGDLADFWRDELGAKNVAILYENLAWTTQWREGDPEMGLPTWADLIEQHGLKVVYVEAVPPRVGMYLPILEAIAKADADIIFYVSSWFTDTEVFTKQWAESTARDIQPVLYGGVGQTRDFWPLTGGKCLGVMDSAGDLYLPVNDTTIPFLEKAHARGLSMQWQPHFTYASIHQLAKSIEKAGGTDDIDAIIKAMEEIEIPFSLGTFSYESERIKPFFHSRIMCDPRDPYKAYSDPGFAFVQCQFQLDGEQVPVFAPEWSALAEYSAPEKYKTPAQLRIEAGW